MSDKNNVLYYTPKVNAYAAVRKWELDYSISSDMKTLMEEKFGYTGKETQAETEEIFNAAVAYSQDISNYQNNTSSLKKAGELLSGTTIAGKMAQSIDTIKSNILSGAQSIVGNGNNLADNNLNFIDYAKLANEEFSVKSKQSWTYYDLSDDITNCSVQRKIGSPSTASITLQNSGGKYTDLFHNQDRIMISCYKDDEEIRLFTGHVTSATAFQLNGADITVQCSCPLHQLELHYWDPDGQEAHQLLTPIQQGMSSTFDQTSLTKIDAILKMLLSGVAGIDESRIHISDIPDDIVLAATNLYLANEDIIKGETVISGDGYEADQEYIEELQAGTEINSDQYAGL